MKKMLTMAVAFSAAIAANADTIADTFESGADGWTGGEVTSAESPSGTAVALGYPIADAAHEQALAVSGTAVRAISAANVIDLLVKVTSRDADPTVDEFDASARFAVATGDDGELFLFCRKTSGGALSIESLGTYTPDTWARLTFVVDYADSSFLVAKNGAIVGKYYLANAEGDPSSVTGVTIIGTTAIDDFVATAGSGATYDPYAAVTTGKEPAVVPSDVEDAAGNAVSVPSNFFAANDISIGEVNARAGTSPLTVAQAYQAGVDPKTGTFDITEATFDGTNLTLVFPGAWPAGSYTVKYGATSACELGEATVSNAEKSGGDNTVTVSLAGLDSSDVVYYQICR